LEYTLKWPIYPRVTDLAAEGIPVAVTCRVLKFSKQGYCRWRTSPVTVRDWVDAHLVNAALDIHADDPAFGYRFIADKLPEKGFAAGENRVQRLCRDHGMVGDFEETGPEPQTRAAGPRRLGGA
jgi:putative transposase